MERFRFMTVEPITTEPSARRPWFFLDTKYYLSQCLRRGVGVSSRAPERLIEHFQTDGGGLALSPNALFDEEYYRSRYPEVRVAVERNRFRSGFDHFQRIGAQEGFSPTWFFDGHRYLRNYPELDDQALNFLGYPDRYSHFLGKGIGEERSGNWLTPAPDQSATSFGRAQKLRRADCRFERPGLDGGLACSAV